MWRFTFVKSHWSLILHRLCQAVSLSLIHQAGILFIHSITESEVEPLKSQLTEMETEVNEMVRPYLCIFML